MSLRSREASLLPKQRAADGEPARATAPLSQRGRLRSSASQARDMKPPPSLTTDRAVGLCRACPNAGADRTLRNARRAYDRASCEYHTSNGLQATRAAANEPARRETKKRPTAYAIGIVAVPSTAERARNPPRRRRKPSTNPTQVRSTAVGSTPCPESPRAFLRATCVRAERSPPRRTNSSGDRASRTGARHRTR
jgi:hypothetical protein